MSNNVKPDDIDDEAFEEMQSFADDANEKAHELGLSPYDVKYWLVDHDDINQLAAYGGFQTRYPHWRWGMQYLRQKKKDTFFGGKIFELVNHDSPSNAFLQKSNRLSDQKSVIAHVEAHADFFANNQWFETEPNAANMLSRHAGIISSYYEDPEISRNEVESWIDAILCIEDTIDQHSSYEKYAAEHETDSVDVSVEEKLSELDVSGEVKRAVFDELGGDADDDDTTSPNGSDDILAFLLEHGKQYDDDAERAIEYDDWQHTVIEVLRKEAYYFAPQKVTKIMNEGWAAYWESIMMASEQMAEPDEIVTFADKQSRVLNAPGLNPYKLGQEMWKYIENTMNRREVLDKLLRVDGISWRTLHTTVDFAEVETILQENRDETDICHRQYSLLRPENRGFLRGVSKSTLQQEERYMMEKTRYNSVEEALQDVDYHTGWERMREIRETHNDITFIDSFLTEEFIDQQQYFSYEFNEQADEFQVSGTQLESVKQKLLLNITNGGKPTIRAADYNFNNSKELLLKHQYNGVALDITKAKQTLKRLFTLWGRPVNLKTILKDGESETGVRLRYDGDEMSEEDVSSIDDIKADEIDYDTKPDEWL